MLEKDSRLPLSFTGVWQDFKNGQFNIPETPHIYAISGHGKLYIGADSNGKRIKNHYSQLESEKHQNWKLQGAYLEHQKTGFYYQPIIHLPLDLYAHFGSIENAYIRNFDSFNNGYNIEEFSKLKFVDRQKNVCGPQIAKIRNRLGMSQPELAVKCQLAGWDVSRDIIARIEGGVRWIGDLELAALASVLEVPLEQLYPEKIQELLKCPKKTSQTTKGNQKAKIL